MKSIKNAFIKSNKIIRYKLGVKEADILATLVYKSEYWKSRNETKQIGSGDYFFASREDIKAETTYGIDTISKAINKLEKEGLIIRIRQGLTKPNLYAINQDNIENFISRNKEDYLNWRNSILSKKGLKTPINSLINENSVSRNCENTFQETEKVHTTNNKITSNKITNKTLTYHLASSVETKVSEDFLEEQINEFKVRMESNDQNVTSDFFSLLCNLVPQFRNFSMSEKDEEMITIILNSEIAVHKICQKIFENSAKIIEGTKGCVFRNLFLGINEMISNYNSLIHGV